MKKMLFALTAFAALGLAACGNGGGASSAAPSTPASSAPTYSDKVLAIEGKLVSAAGPGKTEAGKLDWAMTDAGKMNATSVKGVSEVNKALADKLAGKNLEALYMLPGVTLGAGDAGWNTKILKDGAVTEVDGSFCIKAIVGHYDTEDEVYVTEQWIPDPHTANAENLTPDTLFVSPNWAEAADAQGFDWTTNPAALQAAVYTVVVAQYKEASAPGTFGYGLGLVKTGEIAK